MHHIAIMNPKTCPVADVISRKKTIESRWYNTRRAPWNSVTPGDTIYFKESGKRIAAQAGVSKVQQFENLKPQEIQQLIREHGSKIAPVHMSEFKEHVKDKKYCVLIFLKNAKAVEPFEIDKRGYGNAAAWLVVENINKIKTT
jgi:hypothetical protein